MADSVIPVVAREAERLGLALGSISGTGAGGRVTMADVRRHQGGARAMVSPVPSQKRSELAPVVLFNGGPTIEVDLYSLNPGADYVAAAGNGAPATAAPCMFSNNSDLPPFTSSGVDVGVLRQVQWRYRHAAALSPDRSFVLHCIEDPGDDCVTPAGEVAWRRYMSEVWRWAVAPPEVVTDFSAEDYNAFFGAPRG